MAITRVIVLYGAEDGPQSAVEFRIEPKGHPANDQLQGRYMRASASEMVYSLAPDSPWEDRRYVSGDVDQNSVIDALYRLLHAYLGRSVYEDEYGITVDKST